MKSTYYSILILSLLLFFSCSNDDDTSPSDEIRQNSCELNRNQGFTECCVEGPLTVQPGNLFSATYTTNLPNATYSWEVGGTIEIIEGGNLATAQFRAKTNFVRDTILGLGHIYSTNGIIKCSDIIVITSE